MFSSLAVLGEAIFQRYRLRFVQSLKNLVMDQVDGCEGLARQQ
ncbi:hypothetical protein [Hydrogenophaga sp. NFH-34]|nr:hypothetical protein [Hydrogenophaga sp. NFH-34]